MNRGNGRRSLSGKVKGRAAQTTARTARRKRARPGGRILPYPILMPCAAARSLRALSYCSLRRRRSLMPVQLHHAGEEWSARNCCPISTKGRTSTISGLALPASAASSPIQDETSNPGNVSAMVGTFGANGRRFKLPTPSAMSLTDSTCGHMLRRRLSNAATNANAAPNGVCSPNHPQPAEVSAGGQQRL